MKVSERISQSSDVPNTSQNTTGEEVLTTNYYNSRPNASFRKLTVNSNLTSRLEASGASNKFGAVTRIGCRDTYPRRYQDLVAVTSIQEDIRIWLL